MVVYSRQILSSSQLAPRRSPQDARPKTHKGHRLDRHASVWFLNSDVLKLNTEYDKCCLHIIQLFKTVVYLKEIANHLLIPDATHKQAQHIINSYLTSTYMTDEKSLNI